MAVGPSRQPLDPAVATRPAALEALWLAYTPPLTYRRSDGKNGLQLIPGLAESLPEVSRNGLVYRFRLRSGLRYSDGTRIRAGDFAHSVRRAAALSAVARRLFAGVRAIHAGDRDVTIRLRRPDPSFSYALASTFAGLVPGRTPLRVRGRPPPGLGPYELVATTPDGGFTLRRNRRFKLPGIPTANLDAITARPTRDPAAATREVIAGRIDYMEETPPAALLPDLRSKYSDRFGEHPSLTTRYLLVIPRGPLGRNRLRDAIAYAIDEGKLARLSQGLIQPTCNLVPQQLAGYRKLSPCPWGAPTGSPDLVKARALAGRSAGTGQVAVLAPRGERVVGGYFRSTLSTLGLKARVRMVAAASGAAGRRETEVVLAAQSPPVPDAAELVTGLVHQAPARSLRAVDPRLAQLVARLRDESDLKARDSLAAELDKALVRDAVALPYGQDLRTTFVSERLDLQNCARFHPLYGNDYSAFCLK